MELTKLTVSLRPLLGVLTALLMLVSSGCAFIESAAEITVGSPDIAPIEIESTVSIAQVNEALLENVPADFREQAQKLPLFAPFSENASLLELRSRLCELWKLPQAFPEPRLDVEIEKEDDPNLKSVKFRLEVPVPKSTPDNEKIKVCLETGLTAQAIVEFVPWTIDQAAKVKEQLNTDLADLADAIVQVRFAFSRLDFMRGDDAITSELLEDLSIILTANVEDDPTTVYHDGRLSIVPFFLLDTISEETPQRFELDPDSLVTESIKQTILDPPEAEEDLTMGVEAYVAFREAELFNTPIDQSGFVFKMQPEVTINVLKVLN